MLDCVFDIQRYKFVTVELKFSVDHLSHCEQLNDLLSFTVKLLIQYLFVLHLRLHVLIQCRETGRICFAVARTEDSAEK